MRQGALLVSTRSGLLIAMATGAVLGCEMATERRSQPTAPGVIELALAAEHGALTRPAVRFDHGKHAEALAARGCGVCHATRRDDRLHFSFAGLERISDRGEAMDAVHHACLNCHRQREDQGWQTGPVTCGECHRRHGPTRSARVPLRFDYSLHGRHVQAEQGACGRCHHVPDEKSGKLVYREGTESSCRDCHRGEREGGPRSLRRASHDACVNCHVLRLRQDQPTGPTRCTGCHDARAQRAIETLGDVPRLDVGQPDATWVRAGTGQAPMVRFDHLLHEPVVDSCSSCHHETLAPCADCHTTAGSERGGGVTLETAHHLRTSPRSCVGCHAQEATRPDCAGCHRATAPPPTERSCPVCHDGPLPAPGARGIPVPQPPPPGLPALPAYSEHFPEHVVIDALADEYEPSILPHGRIVAALDRLTRDSAVAARFHGSVDALCAGCHHHAPAGTRPTGCGSCHGNEAHATRDKPNLKAAYHRQCIGCHHEMAIEAVGCTDCHAEKGARP